MPTLAESRADDIVDSGPPQRLTKLPSLGSASYRGAGLICLPDQGGRALRPDFKPLPQYCAPP